MFPQSFKIYNTIDVSLKDIYYYNIYLNKLAMEIFDFIVTGGSEKTKMLDREYRKLINDVISERDEEIEARWEMYNLIIKEFFDIDNGKYFQEIKYRLTDGENPNYVILDTMSRYDENELSGLCSFLKKRVEEYIEEDFFKRFFD